MCRYFKSVALLECNIPATPGVLCVQNVVNFYFFGLRFTGKSSNGANIATVGGIPCIPSTGVRIVVLSQRTGNRIQNIDSGRCGIRILIAGSVLRQFCGSNRTGLYLVFLFIARRHTAYVCLGNLISIGINAAFGELTPGNVYRNSSSLGAGCHRRYGKADNHCQYQQQGQCFPHVLHNFFHPFRFLFMLTIFPSVAPK